MSDTYHLAYREGWKDAERAAEELTAQRVREAEERIVAWIRDRASLMRREPDLQRVAGVICPTLDILADGLEDGEHR